MNNNESGHIWTAECCYLEASPAEVFHQRDDGLGDFGRRRDRASERRVQTPIGHGRVAAFLHTARTCRLP